MDITLIHSGLFASSDVNMNIFVWDSQNNFEVILIFKGYHQKILKHLDEIVIFDEKENELRYVQIKQI